MDQFRFPEGFLWGAATAAHQVEGMNQGNDWWEWEQVPGRIRDGSKSMRAADWWAGAAERDLALAASLGHNAHRMSVEWSRLEPEPGRYDDEAFARYRAILSAGRTNGLKMFVTLHHFTLPAWVARAGGFLNPEIIVRVGALARVCREQLGEHVDAWATFNEPSVLAYQAYAGRRWPPGLGSRPRAFIALRHMLLAHAAAYRDLRGGNAPVGLVLNMPVFDPARPRDRRDRSAAWLRNWLWSEVCVQALATGRLLPPLGAGVKVDPELRGSFDFLGLNYYGRYAVQFDRRARRQLFARHVQEPTVHTEHIDWGQIAPEGLTRNLLRLARLGKPLYVTENGIYDAADSRRPDYLVQHIAAVAKAIEQGADVRGYFHWSLVDNFEWAEGWSTRFGLIAVDPETQTRSPRPSASLYQMICQRNGLGPAVTAALEATQKSIPDAGSAGHDAPAAGAAVGS
jgi:beta-glucosidase